MQRNHNITAAIEKSRPRILDFLAETVNCNSYSKNIDGVNQVAEIVAREMPARFEHEALESDGFADHHRFSHASGHGPPIVLAGHLDTNCPPDRFSASLTEHGDKLLGPGVNDMKGGNTVLIWALKILDELDLLDDLSVICLLNSDEEFGSQTSRSLFTGMEGKARTALVFECGGPAGTLVTTRQGVVRYKLDVRGRAAHHGCMRGPKISAVEELAHKVVAVEGMNRADGSLRTNVGVVQGGLNPNKVAESAAMIFEMCYWTPEVEEEAMRAAYDLAASPAVEGCRIEISRFSYRPPMQPSTASMGLFALARDVAAGLGQAVVEEKRSSFSDANWLAHVGIPTLDGLGPIGDLDFTDDEYIIKQTLFERIELVAHLLMALKARPQQP